jgi:hypothetical protein
MLVSTRGENAERRVSECVCDERHDSQAVGDVGGDLGA